MATKPWILSNIFRPSTTHVLLLEKKSRATAAVVSMGSEGAAGEQPKIADSDLDQAPGRRRVREKYKELQLGIDHCLLKASYTGVKMEEQYVVNSRGLEIFTKSWLPETSPVKATICYCHGYGDTCTFFFEGVAKKLASSGFAVFSMDYPGFGLSDGLHAYIRNFEVLIDDVVEQFSKFKESPDYKSLPSFLYGASMGGAVALKVHLKQPHVWDGAILVAPMCKIADDMVPPRLVKQILLGVAKILPKMKLVPQKDLADMAFKEPQKQKLAKYNFIAYKGRPRLRTAAELLRVTEEIECHLEKVSLPLLILHGEADVVTDCSVSKALYERASSSDKKLLLYKDAYHGLLEGESDKFIFDTLGDIISWLDGHTIRNGS